jgi:hypothetical protein
MARTWLSVSKRRKAVVPFGTRLKALYGRTGADDWLFRDFVSEIQQRLGGTSPKSLRRVEALRRRVEALRRRVEALRHRAEAWQDCDVLPVDMSACTMLQ